MRGLTLDEPGVDDVVRMHEAATFEFDLLDGQPHIRGDLFHGSPRPRRGQTNVVAVNRSRTPLETLVPRVPDEAQTRFGLVGDIRKRARQLRRVAVLDDGLPRRKADLFDRAPGRIVDARHHLGAGVARAHLRLVRQFLQRIVVPELDLDAPVQGAASGRVVRCQRLLGATSVTQQHRRRQLECVLDRQRGTSRASPRQAHMVAVDACRATGERDAIGIADELDDDVFLVGEIPQAFGNLFNELFGHLDGVGLEVQRCNQVLDPGAARVAVDIAQLAHRFHAADLDRLYLVLDQHFLERRLLANLVIPDLDLHAAIERAALFVRVGRGGLGVALPRIGHALGRQRERRLHVLGDLARAFARQAHVVAVDFHEPRRQPLAVGVADEVQAQVHAIAHARENLAERLDRRLGNLGHAGLEVDRRHEPGQLDRFETVLEALAQLDRIAEFGVDALGILYPLHERLIERQVTLDGLAHRLFINVRGDDCERQQHEESGDQLAEGAHWSPPFGVFTGPPRRQWTSGSITSS